MDTALTAMDVLNGFNETLHGTEVWDSNGSGLKFAEGLKQAVQMVLDVQKKKRKVVVVGNGGSAAISSHITVDIWKNGGIRAVAFNDTSLLTCVGNDYGYEHVFAKPVEMFCDPDDLVVVISSSGNSQNIINAARAAKEARCGVISFSGFKTDNSLRKEGNLNFYVPSLSYGVVEVTHLLLLHSIVDEVIGRNQT